MDKGSAGEAGERRRQYGGGRGSHAGGRGGDTGGGPILHGEAVRGFSQRPARGESVRTDREESSVIGWRKRRRRTRGEEEGTCGERGGGGGESGGDRSRGGERGGREPAQKKRSKMHTSRAGETKGGEGGGRKGECIKRNVEVCGPGGCRRRDRSPPSPGERGGAGERALLGIGSEYVKERDIEGISERRRPARRVERSSGESRADCRRQPAIFPLIRWLNSRMKFVTGGDVLRRGRLLTFPPVFLRRS